MQTKADKYEGHAAWQKHKVNHSFTHSLTHLYYCYRAVESFLHFLTALARFGSDDRPARFMPQSDQRKNLLFSFYVGFLPGQNGNTPWWSLWGVGHCVVVLTCLN